LLTQQQIDRFVAEHYLPSRFGRLIDAYYAPLVLWVAEQRSAGHTLLLGINGAQGSGKTTLAAFLQLALESHVGWRAAVLSIDDFYLTRMQREDLAARVHPLLSTRGVPGTHDLELLSSSIESLRNLGANKTLRVPRFDKSLDDRADARTWPAIVGPVDVIILEGWCVGSLPQSSDALLQPLNALEAEQDPSGEWRHFVNEQLRRRYAPLFTQLDRLIFLRVPDFDAVYRWRLEQEQKLAEASATGAPGIMSEEQIARFVQFFERVTRENFRVMPTIADVMLEFDIHHDCVRSCYS